jgi:hypothetical protein
VLATPPDWSWVQPGGVTLIPFEGAEVLLSERRFYEALDLPVIHEGPEYPDFVALGMDSALPLRRSLCVAGTRSLRRRTLQTRLCALIGAIRCELRDR